jgi:hypothetical protein
MLLEARLGPRSDPGFRHGANARLPASAWPGTVIRGAQRRNPFEGVCPYSFRLGRNLEPDADRAVVPSVAQAT